MNRSSPFRRLPRVALRFGLDCAAALAFVLFKLLIPAAALAFAAAVILGQCKGDDAGLWRYADPRENPAEAPEFRGVRAAAPIPAEMHLRNTVGTDAAGLCVPSSVTINGRFQEVPGIEKLLPLARQRPGGYGPEKLAGLINETIPDEKFASYVGTDRGVLDKLSAEGYPIGATMNTGSLYGWQPIHHMISLVHHDSARDVACVVDNNQPGVFNWMRASEFSRRWVDGGTGWAFVWLRKRAILSLEHKGAAAVLAAALIFAAVIVRRRLAPAPLDDEESADERF